MNDIKEQIFLKQCTQKKCQFSYYKLDVLHYKYNKKNYKTLLSDLNSVALHNFEKMAMKVIIA